MRENTDQGNSEYQHFSRSNWIMGVNLKPYEIFYFLKNSKCLKMQFKLYGGEP